MQPSVEKVISYVKNLEPFTQILSSFDVKYLYSSGVNASQPGDKHNDRGINKLEESQTKINFL